MDEPEVELPWMDDRLPVSEAVEVIAQASEEDSKELASLREQVEGDGTTDEDLRAELDEIRTELDEIRSERRDVEDADAEAVTGAETETAAADETAEIDDLRARMSHLESSAGVECPSCGSGDEVLKTGVAAAVFVRERRLSETNVAALDESPLVCIDCMTAFTPHGKGD
jgi:DNA repair exonuclease SbcCD ATPase subunit